MGETQIEHKECADCGEIKPIDEFYSQNKIKANGDNYIYYQPYCKSCASIRSYNWIVTNPEQYEINRYKYRETQKYRDNIKGSREKYKGYYRKWRKDKKEHLNEYQRNRRLYKDHDISKEELQELYKYANSSCMYCGMNEEDSLKIYSQKLHKDHAINDGSNGIENCILACKGCNVSKFNQDWCDWYTTDNPNYAEERYIQIKYWLEIFKD